MSLPKRPSTGAGASILKQIKELPRWQRILVKLVGLALLGGPSLIGMKLVPHLIEADTNWILALIVLAFLALLFFVGLMITIPKLGVYVKETALALLPAKWRRSGGPPSGK